MGIQAGPPLQPCQVSCATPRHVCLCVLGMCVMLGTNVWRVARHEWRAHWDGQSPWVHAGLLRGQGGGTASALQHPTCKAPAPAPSTACHLPHLPAQGQATPLGQGPQVTPAPIPLHVPAVGVPNMHGPCTREGIPMHIPPGDRDNPRASPHLTAPASAGGPVSVLPGDRDRDGDGHRDTTGDVDRADWSCLLTWPSLGVPGPGPSVSWLRAVPGLHPCPAGAPATQTAPWLRGGQKDGELQGQGEGMCVGTAGDLQWLQGFGR